MSLGDDRYGDDPPADYGGTGQTRTRLPDGGDAYGGARAAARLTEPVTVVGVVVLLIAAIAFANRGGARRLRRRATGGDQGRGRQPHGRHRRRSRSTARTRGHRRRASPQRAGRPERGGELRGGAGVRRHVQHGSAGTQIVARDLRPRRRRPTPGGPRQGVLRRTSSASIGPRRRRQRARRASPSSPAPSRSAPRSTSPTATRADVEVWCTGLFGLAGDGSTNPVTEQLVHHDLQAAVDRSATGRSLDYQQKDGPAPVGGDQRPPPPTRSPKAVEEYGGFTYAR